VWWSKPWRNVPPVQQLANDEKQLDVQDVLLPVSMIVRWVASSVPAYWSHRRDYSFPELFGGGQAVDRVRQQVIPNTPIQLNVIGESPFVFYSRCDAIDHNLVHSSPAEEAFTSENWIVRIFAVKKEDDIGRDLVDSTAFEQGTKLKKSKSAKASGGGKKKVAGGRT
jgi:hypothetical protein